MTKLRVSQHSGRRGSPKHNDRSFLTGKTQEERYAMAPHIRDTDQNQTWTWNDADDFEKSELEFYRQHYSAAVEATNARYIENGHPERCKTVEHLYNGKLTKPEELILQIGDKDSNIDTEAFLLCVKSYILKIDQWNREHGGHMQILNIAIHLDEASPHAHIRRVWEYTDSSGNQRLGQNKALELSGIERPDIDKPEGRYNNRKISFDQMARQIWQEVCRSYGYDIETIPRNGLKHKEKAEFIADKLNGEIEEAQKTLQKAKKEAIEAKRHISSLKNEIAVLEGNKHILSRKKTLDIAYQNSFLNKDKVVLEKSDFEDLKNTAMRVEELMDLRRYYENVQRDYREKTGSLEKEIVDLKKQIKTMQENKSHFSKLCSDMVHYIMDKTGIDSAVNVLDIVTQYAINKEKEKEREEERERERSMQHNRRTHRSYDNDLEL